MFGYYKELWLPPKNLFLGDPMVLLVLASSFSKHPCWLLSSCPLFVQEVHWITAFLNLPEFHPLVIRNESHLRSISSPPSQSPNRRTSPQTSSWFQSCEPFSHPSGCGRPPVVCAQLGTGWVGTAGHWGCPAPGMPGEPSPKQWEVVSLPELPQYLLKSLFPSHGVSPHLWNDPTTPLTSRNMVLSQSL